MSTLQSIQQLQFSDRKAAETLLLDFVRVEIGLDVTSVELRPLAVSLNSFNGFLTTADGRRLFFKTHTEPDGIISEYYQSAELSKARYPVLQPVYSSTASGKQLLIYEVIDDPSVFDVSWQIESGDARASRALTAAQHEADDALLAIYRQTLADQDADSAARAPIHQLFHHRLAAGRLTRFYGVTGAEVPVEFPDGSSTSMQAVRSCHWEINGQVYRETLDEMIANALSLLFPAQNGPSVIGHGDAHNGNVFFRSDSHTLLYFDPAFAGRHHPLLDLAKPLFHNVFAMWMYFPHEISQRLNISIRRTQSTLYVQHNYELAPIRHMFFDSKSQRVLAPILADLRQSDRLRHDWRLYLKAALLCCPLLTMNLADRDKFPPGISLLGLAMAVEMGGESQGTRSIIDAALDQIETGL